MKWGLRVVSSQSELPTGFRRWAIVFAAVLGAAVFDLTWLIVGVALPYMQGTFSSTPDQIVWVMTAFIVGGMVMNAVRAMRLPSSPCRASSS